MPIYPLLRDSGFSAEDCQALIVAFGILPKKIGLANPNDPVTVSIAKKLIELRQRGERDPERLCALAMSELGL